MKLIKLFVLACGLFLVAGNSVDAQEGPATPAGAAATAKPVAGPFSDLKAIGAGLVIIGAAYGIGSLAKASVESMARQPEIAGNIQTAMIIAAALIEGVTFFALIIILLQGLF
jgi:F-type H+-transporting ATPase subunit c